MPYLSPLPATRPRWPENIIPGGLEAVGGREPTRKRMFLTSAPRECDDEIHARVIRMYQCYLTEAGSRRPEPDVRAAMSACPLVRISPATWTRPVVTSVFMAVREWASWVISASRMLSLIWSQILSGWPSVTDYEVKSRSVMVCSSFLGGIAVGVAMGSIIFGSPHRQ